MGLATEGKRGVPSSTHRVCQIWRAVILPLGLLLSHMRTHGLLNARGAGGRAELLAMDGWLKFGGWGGAVAEFRMVWMFSQDAVLHASRLSVSACAGESFGHMLSRISFPQHRDDLPYARLLFAGCLCAGGCFASLLGRLESHTFCHSQPLMLNISHFSFTAWSDAMCPGCDAVKNGAGQWCSVTGIYESASYFMTDVKP